MSTTTPELARWLRAFRNGRETSQIGVRFDQFLKGQDQEGQLVRNFFNANGIRRLKDFEALASNQAPINDSAITRPLAKHTRRDWEVFIEKVYDESPVLVAHLWSTKIDDGFLRLDGEDWRIMESPHSMGRHPDIVGGRFLQAPQRLNKSTSTYLFLEFDGPGYTNPHRHPGQELLFVLSGPVSLHLANGVTVSLKAWDMAHFNSEVEHWVEASDPALVLVVRYYHLGGGIVTSLHKHLQEELQIRSSHGKRTHEDINDDDGALDHWDQVNAWLRQMTPPKMRVDRSVRPTKFADTVGLARLINQYLSLGIAKMRRQDLAPVLSKKGSPSAVTRFLNQYELSEDVHDPTSLINGFVNLFAKHGIKVPRTILLPYLAPRAHELVVLSGEPLKTIDSSGQLQDNGRPGASPRAIGWTNWNHFADIIHDKRIRTGYYPEIMLADSDLSMSFVHFVPGSRKKCSLNQHPGFELVLPLKGRIVIEHHDGDDIRSTELVAAGASDVKPAFAIFSSAEPHCLSNPDPLIPAQVLIVRFYEWWEGLQ